MKSNFAIPCPMPLTVGGEIPLPPAMIETLLKRRATELMPRGVAVNQRISARDVSRVVWGLFVARVCGRDTQDRVVSLVVHSRPIAQSRAVARTRTPSATMATPNARSIQ
jgi:hypothetical protein